MYNELVEEFTGYIEDVSNRNIYPTDKRSKFYSILLRLVNASTRLASSQLLPQDLDLSQLSNKELAEKMQMHVTSRSSENTIRLPNSAWSMMLEAAKRLREL